MVGVLPGSLFLMADLVRVLAIPCEVDFLALSEYTPGHGRVRIEKDVDIDVGDRQVVLVEDIVDTGLTTAFVVDELRRRAARSVEVCTMFDRRARRIVPVVLHHVGFVAPDDLLLGYGLDVRGRYRNLGFVAAVDVHVLARDPDAHVTYLYGQ